MFHQSRNSLRTGKHVLRNLLKYARLTLNRTLLRLPIASVTNEFCFSYADSGWNYMRALVAELDACPEAKLADTTFFRFFCSEQVGSIRYMNELFYLHDQENEFVRSGFKFYFVITPWGGWYRRSSPYWNRPWGYYYDQIEGDRTKDLWGGNNYNIWYRPGDKAPLLVEWARTKKLLKSIKQGYWPILQRNFDPPAVVLLRRSDGALRAVNIEGQHRVAILSHLGYRNIVVALSPHHEMIGIISESDVDNWYYVRNGLCSREQALTFFHSFFQLNGRERIDFLGLPAVY